MTVRDQRAQRARNAWRRLVHLLPPRGEVVSPEVPNDLYQAHLSLYLFAASFARGRAAVDLACGTGYGCARWSLTVISGSFRRSRR